MFRSRMSDGAVVIVGGTSGLGLDLARHYVEAGRTVVVTGRHPERAEAAASELGVTGLTFDLAEPEAIDGCLKVVDGPIDHLVLAAIERDVNNVREYDIAKAIRLATLKLVGYIEVIHCLAPQFHDDSSVLLFGGLAKEKPYPGSTTVTSVNGAVETMVRTLALELKPVRVNALHPGIVGDSPAWEGKQPVLDATLEKTPTGRLVTMADVTSAAKFLLENRSVNGVNLFVDGGWVMM
jgi:NAD(P)-dependent dehydrogenase (short-subunit alcohol dehydrogenase family)